MTAISVSESDLWKGVFGMLDFELRRMGGVVEESLLSSEPSEDGGSTSFYISLTLIMNNINSPLRHYYHQQLR